MVGYQSNTFTCVSICTKVLKFASTGLDILMLKRAPLLIFDKRVCVFNFPTNGGPTVYTKAPANGR